MHARRGLLDLTALPASLLREKGDGGSVVRETPRDVLVVSCCSLYVSYAKLCAIVQARQDPDSAVRAVRDCNSRKRILINSRKSRMGAAPCGESGWARFARCSLQIARWRGLASYSSNVFCSALHVQVPGSSTSSRIPTGQKYRVVSRTAPPYGFIILLIPRHLFPFLGAISRFPVSHA